VLGLLAVALAAFIVHWLAGSNVFALVTSDLGGWSYLSVFLFVWGDAVCALLPGETTLNAAATLAAHGSLDLWLVMLSGALGAIVGDSSLYWIARRFAPRIRPRLEQVERNSKVAAALGFLGSNAPLLLIAGRYVPGLRFVVNATMGLSAYPYRRFLFWSSIGGTLWSVYTCGLAYLVGTALSDFPLASVIISGAITTAAIGVVFVAIRQRNRPAGPPGEGGGSAAEPGRIEARNGHVVISDRG
jgi:membrane protein DedA with SNARE-associated domain